MSRQRSRISSPRPVIRELHSEDTTRLNGVAKIGLAYGLPIVHSMVNVITS